MPAGAQPVRRAKTLEQCFIFLKDDGGEPLLPLKAVVWTTPYRIHNFFLVKAVCTHGAANPQQGKQRRLGAARRGAHRGGEASGCLGPVFAPRDGRVGQGGGDHAGLPGGAGKARSSRSASAATPHPDQPSHCVARAEASSGKTEEMDTQEFFIKRSAGAPPRIWPFFKNSSPPPGLCFSSL